MQKAYELAAKAQALDPSLSMAVSQLGLIALAQGKFEEGEKLLQRAVAINPEGADTFGNLAYGLVLMGRHAQALDALERAMGLSPHHARSMDANKAEALFHLNRFEDALPCLRESQGKGGSPVRAPLLMAATYAALGREQECRAAVGELVVKYPEFRLALLLERRPYRRQEDQERLATLAAKAGIPA